MSELNGNQQYVVVGSAASVMLLPANPRRETLTIINSGANTANIYLGAPASSTLGFALLASGVNWIQLDKRHLGTLVGLDVWAYGVGATDVVIYESFW